MNGNYLRIQVIIYEYNVVMQAIETSNNTANFPTELLETIP